AARRDALPGYARVSGGRRGGVGWGGAPAAGGGRGGGGRSHEPIISDPIGVDGLNAELAYEMIPYSPQELIDIAEREYAFSLSEAKEAAKEMGFGGGWKGAMEKVKDTYVDPGRQPE